VRWGFTIPGQPPSWNHSYQITKRYTRGSVPYSTLSKKEVVVDYQRSARLIIRSARPSGWGPEGMVRVYYTFWLARDIDCDNILKAVNDALASAIGCDDSVFLPCVIWKTIGVPKTEARIEVAVEDRASPSLGPPTWSTIPSPSSTS
jgi:Holliday junction resolvase RusA-like endonuclease